MDSARFSLFNFSTTAYKIINRQEIPAHVLVPKKCRPGKRPILLRFHGGLFVKPQPDLTLTTTEEELEVADDAPITHSLHKWLLDYACQESALVVCPSYSFLSEATGLDILENLSDCFEWLHRDFPAYLARHHPSIEADLSRVICTGESAGGYLAIQSALTQPEGTIKAVIAAYPTIDVDSDCYTNRQTTTTIETRVNYISGLSNPYMAMGPSDLLTEAFQPLRADVLYAAQRGELPGFAAQDVRLNLIRSMERVEKAPLLFAFHGVDDSVLPIQATEMFVSAFETRFGEDNVHLYFGPGEHGFDKDLPLNTPWLQEGLGRISGVWLNGNM